MQTKLMNTFARRITYSKECTEQLATQLHAMWENHASATAGL